MAFNIKEDYVYGDLVELVELLRSPEGCPWDREQTHASVRMNFLEEAYEVCDAIDKLDDDLLCEELGDVLLQVVFHAQIARERGAFDADKVADMVCKKLVVRHPHVFKGLVVDGSAQVLINWDEIKRETKSQKDYSDAMRGVASSLPALTRAEKIQKKAASAGFDWPCVAGALDKLLEEIEELKQAGDPESVLEELGDLLFAAVNVSRLYKVDPELALIRANDKFISRFEGMERAAKDSGRILSELSLEEQEKLWIGQKSRSQTGTKQ